LLSAVLFTISFEFQVLVTCNLTLLQTTSNYLDSVLVSVVVVVVAAVSVPVAAAVSVAAAVDVSVVVVVVAGVVALVSVEVVVVVVVSPPPLQADSAAAITTLVAARAIVWNLTIKPVRLLLYGTPFVDVYPVWLRPLAH